MKKTIIIFNILYLTILTSLFCQYVQLGSKLVASDAIGDAQLGYSIAISDDNKHLFIGGIEDNSGVGATWVYTFNGTYFSQAGSKLVGTNYVGTSKQGRSVAITPDKKYLAIGGWYDNSGKGAVWIYSFNGENFSQMGNKLVGSGTIGQAYFGTSLDFSKDGKTLIIGGPKNNNYEGAIWVYTFNGTNYVQFGNLIKANDAVAVIYGSQQGNSVAVSGDGKTIVAGGFWDNNKMGATWVYTFNGTNYVQYGSKLIGTGYVLNTATGVMQGYGVDITEDGRKLAIGGISDNSTKGAIWIYSFTGSSYTQIGNKKTPNDVSSDSFVGRTLQFDQSGEIIVVSCNSDNNLIGSASVFKYNNGDYEQYGSKLVGTEGVGQSLQGTIVSISKNSEYIFSSGVFDNNNKGAVWVFKKQTDNTLIAYYPFNGNANDESGNNNHGTTTGASFSTDRNSSLNSALSLSSSSSMKIPSNIYKGGDFTVSTWINVSSFGEFARIFDFGSPWNLSLTDATPSVRGRLGANNGEITFEYMNGNTTHIGEALQTGKSITAGKWQHIAYTLKQSTVKIYLDGGLIFLGTINGLPVSGENIYTHNYINKANRTDYNNQPMNALFDDFRIYNVALDDVQILNLFSTTCTGIGDNTIEKPIIGRSGNNLRVNNSISSIYYQWYKNGNLEVGQNNAIHSSDISTAIYKVRAYNECTSVFSDEKCVKVNTEEISAKIVEITTVLGNCVQSLSTVESDANKLFSIHPNPSNGNIFIVNHKNTIIDKIDIYNLQGEKLFSFQNHSVLDLSQYPKGLYILKISTENFEYQHLKVLIE